MRRLRVGMRLGLAFGLMVVLLGGMFAVDFTSMRRVRASVEAANRAERMVEMLAHRQVDHMAWLERLSRTFLRRTGAVEGVALDHTACALGEWLYGPDGRALAEEDPEAAGYLKAMEGPHQRLHASAVHIRDLLEARLASGADSETAHDEALEVYEAETKPSLDALREEMTALAGHLEARGARLEEKTAALRARTTTIGLTFVGVSVALSIGLGVAITRSVVKPLAALEAVFARVADGDLRSGVADRGRDELARVASAFNNLVAKLGDVFGRVSRATEEVASAAEEIAASSDQTAKGMRDQSAQTEQVATAVEEISSAIQEVAGRGADTRELAQRSGDTARSGVDSVGKTIEGMEAISLSVSETNGMISELGERADEIGSVINVITDIADQTNLLALNAAIEAARAGEHGRGFAVVADEVRKLAERTTQATSEVAGSIGAIQEQTKRAVSQMSSGSEKVGSGVELAREAGARLDEIVAGSADVMRAVDGIASASEQQSATVAEISQSMEQIAKLASETTSASGQSAEAASSLSAKSDELRGLMSGFRFAGG